MRRENEKGRANPMAMSAEERQQMLLTQPVEKIIPKMALPTICSMLITSIYNMADTYFVSQIGTAAYVPAAAVKRRSQALSGITGCKGSAGGKTSWK